MRGPDWSFSWSVLPGSNVLLVRRFLIHAPARAKEHTWFRILTLRQQIENINAEAAGEKGLIPPVTIEKERENRWILNFQDRFDDFVRNWVEAVKDRDRRSQAEFHNIVTNFLQRVKEFETWLDAVPRDYHGAYQLLRGTWSNFQLNFPSDKPYGGPGGLTITPEVPAHQIELGDAIIDQTRFLLKAIQTGTHFHTAT